MKYIMKKVYPDIIHVVPQEPYYISRTDIKKIKIKYIHAEYEGYISEMYIASEYRLERGDFTGKMPNPCTFVVEPGYTGEYPTIYDSKNPCHYQSFSMFVSDVSGNSIPNITKIDVGIEIEIFSPDISTNRYYYCNLN
jgi:hypothetical protein